MLKRLWKADRVFSFLFLLAFTMTYCTVYLGMVLERGLHQVGQTVEQTDYRFEETYNVNWTYGIRDKANIKLPELFSGILSFGVLVSERDIVRRNSLHREKHMICHSVSVAGHAWNRQIMTGIGDSFPLMAGTMRLPVS